jgi:1-deoxy-D-xylulose-5-phosphate reductoisomerase
MSAPRAPTPGPGPSGTRRLIVLGSTGSIGTNALEVVDHLERCGAASFDVVGLAAGNNASLLAEQARRWRPAHVALANGPPHRLPEGTRVHAGPEAALALVEAAARPGDLVLAAMVGAAGLPAVLAAIDRGCDVALANKETLVAAGALVMPLVRARAVQLLPVDSEHSAIAQCLRSGRSVDEVERLVLTASGGPFRTWSAARMERATADDALAHPTWRMGRKITVDSASLMNKALEVIEAHWLFGLPAERIDVVVHPQSIVHSFVEFVDGSVLAQLGPPDMRTPIQYALTWPNRRRGGVRRMEWTALRELVFEPLDEGRFPSIAMARAAIRAGGTAGAVFNAANEAAVGAFLSGRTSFRSIFDLVQRALDAIEPAPVRELADVTRADARARAVVEKWIDHRCSSSRPSAASC